MQKLTNEVEAILKERFGRNNLLPLATLDGCFPVVRNVNAYYENSAFYIITDSNSGKMRQLAKNASCAICGESFSAQGIGISLGWVGSEENSALYDRLRKAFAEWIDNGHCDPKDKSCIILKLRLTNGLLFSHGVKYEIDFT